MSSRKTLGRRRGGSPGERGADMVEFGLILLPLITLIFGVIEGARYAWSYNQLQDAVRAGTIYAINNYDSVSSGSDSNVTNAVRQTLIGELRTTSSVTVSKGVDATTNWKYVSVGVRATFTTAVNFLPFKGQLSAVNLMRRP